MVKCDESLAIYQVLKKYSSEKVHIKNVRPNSEDQGKVYLRNYLWEDYGIDLGYAAIDRKIEEINNTLVDEQIEKDSKGYYMRSRLFTNSEANLLLSSIASNKHISEKHANVLKDKILDLSNQDYTNSLRDIRIVGEWAHLDNEDYFKTITIISEAIRDHKQIAFQFNGYLPDPTHTRKLKKTPRHTVLSVCSPYEIISHEGNLYLAHCKQHEKDGVVTHDARVSYQRIDRMSDVTVLDTTNYVGVNNMEDCKIGIDHKAIATGMPFMYSDKHEIIVMEMDYVALDRLVDACGTDITATHIRTEKELDKDGNPYDVKIYRVSLRASKDAMILWIGQYATHAKAISPKYVVEGVKENLKKAMQKNM